MSIFQIKYFWASAAIIASPFVVDFVHAAELELPNIFTDHMVVQRDQENPIWGHGMPNTKVSVSVNDRKSECVCDESGNWRCKLPSLAVGGPYELKVENEGKSIELSDVLSGEVWVCSGQSNMGWTVQNSEDFELEKLSANYPNIRMINFPQVGTQETVWTHKRDWLICNSENVGTFSAVGYFFGRQLNQTLDVPIGLINNAWGGSAAEAWVDADHLTQQGGFESLLQQWERNEASFAKLESMTERDEEQKESFNNLKKLMTGNHRPGNIYHGVLESHLGYGIRGAIWYQGESNAGRAYQYRELFPTMISFWRDKWGQGNFPFYWVQLADYHDEANQPNDSAWAELREAQTMTLDKLPHVGQAVIIDLGEGKDIHPRNKVEVGRRLARLALKNEYGYKIAADAPRFTAMEIDGANAILSFSNAEKGWRPFDVNAPRGFTIADKSKEFVSANAEILEDGRIRVWADSVANPEAVRYAWADNPVVNLFTKSDLPLTPFRTDDWPGVTVDK